MGRVQAIVTCAYDAIRNNPSIALIAVLTWVPSSLAWLISAGIVKNFLMSYDFGAVLTALESDPARFFSSAFGFIGPYLLPLSAALLLYLIAYYCVRASYPPVAFALHSGRPVSIAGGLREGLRRMPALAATDALFALAMLFVFAAAIAIPVLLLGALGMAGLILGGILFMAVLFAQVVYSVPVLLVLDGVVVLGGRSGIGALKEAYLVVKSRKLDAWVFYIAVEIIAGVFLFSLYLLQGLSSLAVGYYSGLILLVFAIFSTAFSCICHALFYLDAGAARGFAGFPQCGPGRPFLR